MMFLKMLFRKRVFPLTETSGTEKSGKSFSHLTVEGLSVSLPLAIFIITSQLAAENYRNSFLALIASAICALLMNLCLCEYKCLPRCQTSLIYTCFQINGELPSYLIGWSLLLYQMSALASCAKTISFVVNVSCKRSIQNWLLHTFGAIPFTKQPPDFVGLTILLLCCAISIASECRRSKLTYRILILSITIIVVACFVIVGATNSEVENILSNPWRMSADQVLRNASICASLFYSSFLMNSCGSSYPKTKLVLPLASILQVVSTFVFSESLIMTIPYITQGRSMISGTFLFQALEIKLEIKSLEFIRYFVFLVISLSFFFCLCCALLLDICQSVCMTIRSLASQGLLFRALDHSSWRSYIAVVFPSSLAVLLVNTHKLVDLMAIGYLTLSSIVLLCVLHQRYRTNVSSWQYQQMITEEVNNSTSEETTPSSNSPSSLNNINDDSTRVDPEDSSDSTDIDDVVEEYKDKLHVATVTALDKETALHEPTRKTENRVTFCLILLCIVILPLESLFTSDFWYFRLVGCLLIILGIVLAIVINRQPQVFFDKAKFRVPFLPFTASMALCCHITLLMNALHHNWIWVAVWMISGLIIYAGYGIRHSSAVNVPNPTIESNQEAGEFKLHQLSTKTTREATAEKPES